MKKRILSLTLAAVIALSTLAGCGSKSNTPAASKSTESSASSETTKLEFYLQKTDAVDVFTEIIKRFEAKNPNIKIALTSVPDPETALVTRIASSDYPDIISIWPAENFYRDLMRDGVLMNISDQAFLNNVNDSTRKIAQYNGKDYALSVTMSAYGLIVNNKIFKDNNLKKPETWDELIEVSKQLKAKNIQPFSFCDKSTEQLGQMAERMIGILDNDITSKFKKVGKGESTWNKEAEMKELANAMLQLRTYGQADPLGTGYEDALNDIATEKSAMLLYGSWGISTLLKINPKLDCEMIMLPNPTGGKNMVPVSIDTALTISETCKNKEAALKFLDFMSSKETAQYYADVERNPSVIKSVTYNVKPLQTMSDKINAGEIFFSPSVYWPAGFRKSWEAPLQNLLISKNVDGFIKDTNGISAEYFAKEK